MMGGVGLAVSAVQDEIFSKCNIHQWTNIIQFLFLITGVFSGTLLGYFIKRPVFYVQFIKYLFVTATVSLWFLSALTLYY